MRRSSFGPCEHKAQIENPHPIERPVHGSNDVSSSFISMS